MVWFQLPTFFLLYKVFRINQKSTASRKKTTLLLLNPPHSSIYSCAAGEVSCSGSMVGALVATSDWFTDGSQGLQTMTETEEDVETCGGVGFRTELKVFISSS
ncbi:hypothetical protein DY000_02060584 [Brassica cretica]|uniref:Uncharacterized protein n=1 Tax=Brassica cretica TaxID=69181 RepID=A0ABQ7B2B0_BRACR|nr:hypothetical protein DY000_02060584 [Brassica cretica]